MTSEEPVSGGGPTSEYKGASLETLTVVLAVISFLIVLVRGVARQRISRIVESTDILLPIALVIAIAQSTCVRLSLSTGLGRHISTLDAAEKSLYQKLTYTSNILFQLVLSLTQAIVILLIKNVEPQQPVRIGCNCLLGFIAVYSTLALSILSFQCDLPEPWLVGQGRCVNRELFFTAFLTVNIVVDTVTLLLPIIMMCKLKTSRDKKILVCTLFGTRIAVPLLMAPQLQTLHPKLASHDPTWDMVSTQTWLQIIMNVSLITACLPSLGRMMWELLAFGSGLRSTRSSTGSESRDFGHELGLEHAPLNDQEKPYIQEPGPAIYVDEKGGWGNQVFVQVRELGTFPSGSPIIKQDKYLPTPPQRAASLFRPRNIESHHYRRPISGLPSPLPVLDPAPQYSALDVPTRLSNPLPASGRLPYSSIYSGTLTLGADTESSSYDEDSSEIDIDSYYLGNTQVARSYIPSRTELVLQSMIDDLQRASAASVPGRKMEGGWI